MARETWASNWLLGMSIFRHKMVKCTMLSESGPPLMVRSGAAPAAEAEREVAGTDLICGAPAGVPPSKACFCAALRYGLSRISRCWAAVRAAAVCADLLAWAVPSLRSKRKKFGDV